MQLSDDDLNIWNIFTNKCKLNNSENKNYFSTEKGRLLLKTIKQNLKNKVEIVNINEKIYNNGFEIEKDKTLGIDKNSDKRLLKGKYKIDDKIDLHGLTIEQAYNKVKSFFEKSIKMEHKCILIITGKGLHSTNKTIKSSITDWLKEPYFSNKIIKYTNAHISHGGSGAIYILLKSRIIK